MRSSGNSSRERFCAPDIAGDRNGPSRWTPAKAGSVGQSRRERQKFKHTLLAAGTEGRAELCHAMRAMQLEYFVERRLGVVDEVITTAAVRVRLDEAGQDIASGGVDELGVVGGIARIADVGDDSILTEQTAVDNCIAQNELSVCDEQSLHFVYISWCNSRLNSTF